VGARQSAFTMIEIALCLAIIGFALVSILLVLPSGMNTQRDTREETIVGQDASMLLESIRGGARGTDDLTNYVYLITNYWAYYNNLGKQTIHGQNGYSFQGSTIANQWPQTPSDFFPITNGSRIIGLLSTPEYTDGFQPITNLYNGGYSNHVVAFVRSVSGLAIEKPPQNNSIMQENSFSYRLLCVNAPMAADTNSLLQSDFTREMARNLREVRLLFQWPLQPNGSVGFSHQNFRTSVAGLLLATNEPGFAQALYFYQSEYFTNAP
jgi:type II secretory pathway pseudopilin PulG